MADNVQKTPFGQSMNRFAREAASKEIQQTGRSLPCSVVSVMGSIVQVKFEIQAANQTPPNVTIPAIGYEYIRFPIQPGCKGMVIAADAYLGGMSALGGGVADLTQRANLSTLVFVPIGNKNWSTVDGNAVVIYGPNGVTMRDQDSTVTVTLTPGNGIVIDLGGKTLHITNGDVHVDGEVVAGFGTGDQITLRHHVHSGISRGTANTDEPVPGT